MVVIQTRLLFSAIFSALGTLEDAPHLTAKKKKKKRSHNIFVLKIFFFVLSRYHFLCVHAVPAVVHQ